MARDNSKPDVICESELTLNDGEAQNSVQKLVLRNSRKPDPVAQTTDLSPHLTQVNEPLAACLYVVSL